MKPNPVCTERFHPVFYQYQVLFCELSLEVIEVLYKHFLPPSLNIEYYVDSMKHLELTWKHLAK